MVLGSAGVKKDDSTLARFLRHSVQAFGVTTPRPRRLLLAWALAASCEAAAGDGAGCFSDVVEGGSGLFEDWAERLRESSSIATIYKGCLWHMKSCSMTSRKPRYCQVSLGGDKGKRMAGGRETGVRVRTRGCCWVAGSV